MTVQELIEETYHALGEPTNYIPYAAGTEIFDIGSSGASQILGWLNRAYRRICSWKMPNGKILRFRSTEKSLYFHGVSVSDTAVAGGNNTITFPAGMSNIENRYRSWCIEITGGTGSGQLRMIVVYSIARVATVQKPWDTNPDATSTFTITKNFYDFLSATHVLSDDNIPLSAISEIFCVAKIRDLQDGVTLGRAGRTTDFNNIELNTNNPVIYKDIEGGIRFDSSVKDDRYYELRYFGYPESLVNATDVPQIPEAFHEAILLWMIWWGLGLRQEFSGAYSMKRNLEETIATLVQPYERMSEQDETFLTIEGDY